MAADRIDVDFSTIADNPEEKLVEFNGEVDGDEFEFAVQYPSWRR